MYTKVIKKKKEIQLSIFKCAMIPLNPNEPKVCFDD